MMLLGRRCVLLPILVVCSLLVMLALPASRASAAGPAVQTGDLLINNYGFEQGLTGWTPSDGQGSPLRPECSDVAAVGTTGAVQGSEALQLTGRPPCLNVGMVSDAVLVHAGQQYTAFADVTSANVTSLAIRWIDSAGTVIDRSVLARDHHSGTMRVTGTAPAGTVSAAIELGALRAASLDRVLFTAEATVIGPEITKAASFLSTTVGVDEHGRAVVYGVGSGSATSPAVLVQVNILTRTTTRVVELPGATGGWTVKQAPDGTVYVGTYGSAALWSYHPGDTAATRIGPVPVAGTDVIYGLSIDENNVVYGGVHSSSGAAIWTYTPGKGFGILGPQPLVPGREYTRSGGYDPVTKSVVYGTGTQAHVMACSTTGAADCIDLISLASPDVQASQWAYGMTVSDGYAMAWVGDGASHGNDWLVIYQLSRDAGGTLQAALVAEIKGVVYNGSSGVEDGKVYYNKVPSPVTMYSYDLATGIETRIGAASPSIFARSWDFADLNDPAWPGQTLVGMDSHGTVQTYNPQTGRAVSQGATGLPVVSVGINSIVGGPDGRIWSSGYLVGGLGAHTPMRDDEHQTWALGGQASGMTSYAGKVWQGIYPSGTIQSIDPNAEPPTPKTKCTITPHQSRPFGMLGHDGRIYWGTMADYGETAGAFGYYDLKTDQCVNIPGVGDQTVVTIAASGHQVYAGTMIYGGLNSEPQETQATVLRFDETTGQSTRIPLPVPARSVNASATAPDGTVWFLVEGWLLALDPATDTWIYQKEIFPDTVPAPGRISAHYAQMITVNGNIYGNVNGRVFGFDPAAMLTGTGAVKVIMSSGAGALLAADQFGNLYTIWHSSHLLRLVV